MKVRRSEQSMSAQYQMMGVLSILRMGKLSKTRWWRMIPVTLQLTFAKLTMNEEMEVALLRAEKNYLKTKLGCAEQQVGSILG